MDPHIAAHVEDVRKWLKANVKSYPPPSRLELSSFRTERETLKGSFDLSLDGVLLSERMNFTLADSGWVELRIPLFHSPLGAPASYAAFEFSEETELAIGNALRQAIPRIRPCGRDSTNGRMTYPRTPVSERILDADAFEAAMHLLQSPGFRIDLLINKGS